VAPRPSTGFAHCVSIGACEDASSLWSVPPERPGPLVGDRDRASLATEPGTAHEEARGGEPARTLVLPIALSSETIGYLGLGSKPDAQFSDQDARLGRVLAARTSIVLAAALYHEARDREKTGAARWLQEAVDQWREGLVVVNEKGKVVLENVAAYGFDGSSLVDEEVRAGPSRRISYRSGAPIAVGESPLERAVFRGETTIGMECLAIGLPHGDIPLLQSATPVLIDGKRVGAIAVLQELGSVEEQTCESRVMVLGHDLRQPLNVITLAIGMAQRSAGSSDSQEHQRALGRIASAAERLNSMIDDLVER
jgi:signal transduction histidine kinase